MRHAICILLLCLCQPVSASEHPLAKEIAAVMKPLSPRGQEYLLVCLANGGFPPVIEVSNPRALKVGDLGFADIRSLRVTQVVGKEHFLANDAQYMVQCGDTSNLADGDLVDATYPKVFYYDMNESYTTAIGATRTVPSLVVLAVDEYADELAAVMDLSSYRTWTTEQQKFSVLAKFLGFGDGDVKLRRYDTKKEIDVPMQRLSKDDQTWVQQEQRRLAEIKKRGRERTRRYGR